jgi:adenylate kinase family enzyme
MGELKRVAIIGAPGSGKTTLAIKLKEIYKLPVVFLDSFYGLPNWVMRDPKERDAMILEETKKEEWIIDGTFIDTLEERVKVADLVIFLDFSTGIQLRGIVKRFFSNIGNDKIDMPGCKERLNPSFVHYVATYNKKRRKYIVEILEKYNQNKILHFTKRAELNKWLEHEKDGCN